MKRTLNYTLFASLVVLLTCMQVSAQKRKQAKAAPSTEEAGALFFDKTYINLGSVEDTDTPIPVEFTFRNVGKSPVTIKEIQVGCSCLAAEWPKEPVKFNENGKITLLYYPKGRSGNQEKEITVYTNGRPDNYTLKLAVYVNDRNAQQAKLYPSSQGNLRFSTYDIRFKELTTTAVDSQRISIYNPTDRTVRIMGIKAPNHIKVTPSQTHILSQQAIAVDLKYFAQVANDYGERQDEILISTFGDTLFPEKKLLVKSKIVEDFSGLKEKERANPPVFEAVTPVVDLDTIAAKSVVTAEFVVKNTGKTPMYLRKVYGTCGCTAIEYDSKKPVKRNKTAVVRVTYSTNYELGPVTKKIYVITNTPQQPMHEMLLKANIVYGKKP